MNIAVKRLKCGFELPVYGLGLWQVGGREVAATGRDEVEIAALDAALSAGITHFDTAESYAAGHSEELLGLAIQGVERASLTIATKVSAHNQRRDDLLRSFEASLKRLRLDYVDLYILHRYPEPGIPIAETMATLDLLVAEGRVKWIGASNFSVSRMAEAQKRTANPIVCNQVHYNVQVREPEVSGILEYAQQHDVLTVAWRPLQKGSLPSTNLISGLAAKYGKTESQIVLNWLISQDSVVAIAKTSSLPHLYENLGAVGWSMEPEDVERIRRDFPEQRPVSDAVPLNYPGDDTITG